MNIQTVADNLRNTIAGKEEALKRMVGNYCMWSEGERLAMEATRSYLKINIDELTRILNDVEQCLPKAAK